MSIRSLPWSICTLLLAVTATTTTALAANAVNWRTHLDSAKVEAAQSGKLLLLHFYTPNCGPCRMLDQNVFSQPQVGEAIEQNFVPVKINADENPATAAAYRIERVPSEVVLNNQGNVVASLSCPQNPNEYSGQLANLAEHYRRHVNPSATTNQAPVQAAYAGLQVGQYANQPTAQSYAAAQPEANSNATANPYMSAPTSHQQITGNVAASAPVSQYSADASMPANAMPNSYHQQEVAAAQQPTSPQVAAPVEAGHPQVANHSPVAPQQVTNPAAQVSPVSHMSVTREMPPGTPPLAFDGYCPVSLRANRKWIAGDAQFGAIHRGRTFLFTGEEQRQQFLANPDAYCPVFSGVDPVLLLDNNQVVEGSRRFGFDYRGAFYLFSSEDSMNRFKSQPDIYAAGVRQAMSRMEASTTAGTTVK